MKHSHSYYQQIPYTKYFKRQKQPFAGDLKILLKICNIHRKAPVLKSLCNKVAGLKIHNFIRKRLHHMCFLAKNISKFLRTTFKEAGKYKLSIHSFIATKYLVLNPVAIFGATTLNF